MNETERARKVIFLIGGRACGKTTIGKLLAQKLQMEFLDMDKTIEELEGKNIQQLVTDEGWEFFRKKEENLLQKLVGQDNLIIASGGGAILHQNIWPTVMKNGFVVWLNAKIETVQARLINDHKTAAQRPSLTGENILSETEKVMAAREPLYRKGSHLCIDSGQPVKTIIETIEKGLKEGKRGKGD